MKLALYSLIFTLLTTGTLCCQEPVNTALHSVEIESILHRAIRSNNLERVKKILLSCSNPNIRNTNGITPLMLASYYGNVIAAQLLLAQHAQPDLTSLSNKSFDFGRLLSHNNKGSSALMLAAYAGKFEVVAALLGAKADPNLQDSDGQTALMYVILGDKEWPHTPLNYTRKQIINALLDAGADAHIADNNGLDAAYYYSCVAGLVPGFDGKYEKDEQAVNRDPLYRRLA